MLVEPDHASGDQARASGDGSRILDQQQVVEKLVRTRLDLVEIGEKEFACAPGGWEVIAFPTL